MRLLDDLDGAAAYEGFDLLDEGNVGGYGEVMGFEVYGELVGLFEAEHDFAGAGGGAEEGVEFGEEAGVGAMQRDADAEGVGEF